MRFRTPSVSPCSCSSEPTRPRIPPPPQMIKPFMDAKTAGKIRFLHADDPAKARQVLGNVFDNLDDLERSLGGNGEEYDCEKYGAQMRCDFLCCAV